MSQIPHVHVNFLSVWPQSLGITARNVHLLSSAFSALFVNLTQEINL